ncbi:MAG: hypothetical protein K2Q34_07105 [Alphaproteobacteria bacterium]|nr:hypothetical protein [Alphaproteobacteria bacterium]
MAFPLIAAAFGLAEFAPMIARWLGGNQAQDVAAQVVNIAQKITGCDDAAGAVSNLKENPSAVIEFQKAVLEMDKDLEVATLQDRQNARNRDIALAQVGHKNVRADIMVVSAAMGLIMCLASLAFYSEALPGEAVGIISTVAGIFGACLKDAYAFEFGSSRGSKEKDVAVAAMLGRGAL